MTPFIGGLPPIRQGQLGKAPVVIVPGFCGALRLSIVFVCFYCIRMSDVWFVCDAVACLLSCLPLRCVLVCVCLYLAVICSLGSARMCRVMQLSCLLSWLSFLPPSTHPPYFITPSPPPQQQPPPTGRPRPFARMRDRVAALGHPVFVFESGWQWGSIVDKSLVSWLVGRLVGW